MVDVKVQIILSLSPMIIESSGEKSLKGIPHKHQDSGYAQ